MEPDSAEKEDKAEEAREAKESNESKEPEETRNRGEREEHAPEDARAKVKAGTFAVSVSDSTLNAMPSAGGKILMTLNEGGFQHLLASARATAGVKAGRYMFEVRLVELMSPPADGPSGRDRRPNGPRHLVRVGFSTAGSSLFLGDTSDSVCFDSEGNYVVERKESRVAGYSGQGQRFLSRYDTLAVVLNLDGESPNANTISLFKNGVRASEPQSLPASLVGKVLFPMVTYRGVTLQVNFGPVPRCQLPFTCRMVEDAAQADVQPADESKGKCEVLMPVGMPDMGYFDWVDTFLNKNPSYMELSDRMFLEWAVKSGVYPASRPRAKDKPDGGFNLPALDDVAVQRVMGIIAPMQQRNYVIAELKSNLVAAERAQVLERFPATKFSKKAVVVVGEPKADYKAHIQDLILKEKIAKAAAEKRRKAQDAERIKHLEERKRRADDARTSRDARKDGEDGEGAAEDEKKEEREAEGKEETTEEAPVELTDEEKAMWYRQSNIPDIGERALSKSYAKFSLPTKDEGFDAVSFEWQPEAASIKLIKDWVLEQKLTQKVEDLQPGEWFKTALAKWDKTLQDWKNKQSDWDRTPRRDGPRRNRDDKDDKDKDVEKGEGDANKEEKEKEGDTQMEVNAEDLDPMNVEDVTNIGNGGEPLFAHFEYEDWTLLATRYEFHLMLHSFKKDLDDPDRPGFGEKHLEFYFNKYLRKRFSLNLFNLEKIEDFVDLIKDTVEIGKERGFLLPILSDETEPSHFVKLTEEHRRDRQRSLDAGDETAKLKFNRSAPPPPRHSGPPQAGGGGRGPPPASRRGPPPPQPSRYGSGGGSHGSARPGHYGGGGGGGGVGGYSPQGQKRPYPHHASTFSHGQKHPRTSYGGSGIRRDGGGGGGYSGGGYSRR